MRYRLHRDTETRPRRVHATDDEWAQVTAGADREESTISSFLIRAGLLQARRTRTVVTDSRSLRLLALSHEALSRIADQLDRQPLDLDVREAVLRLENIEGLLEAALVQSMSVNEEDDVSCW